MTTPQLYDKVVTSGAVFWQWFLVQQHVSVQKNRESETGCQNMVPQKKTLSYSYRTVFAYKLFDFWQTTSRNIFSYKITGIRKLRRFAVPDRSITELPCVTLVTRWQNCFPKSICYRHIRNYPITTPHLYDKVVTSGTVFWQWGLFRQLENKEVINFDNGRLLTSDRSDTVMIRVVMTQIIVICFDNVMTLSGECNNNKFDLK